MTATTRRASAINPTLVSIAVAACFSTGLAFANPTGPSVVAVQASFNAAGKSLTVTNSANAIINWQGFQFTLPKLETFFRDLITPYLDWIGKVYGWQSRRDRSIQQLDFPYGNYRPGQREMAVVVYKAIRAKDRLYVQSPTGVGKTIATLFPAVKALGQGLAAKIFYLTANNIRAVCGRKDAG